MIVIITPSRRRPKELYRFFESINNTMSNEIEINFVIGTDEDDPAKTDYTDTFDLMLKFAKSNLIMQRIEDTRKSIGKIWNDITALYIRDEENKWFIMGNDDLIYKTKDWDIILRDKINSLKHPYHLLWFNDSVNRGSNSTFPIVSREWIDLLGWFVYPKLRHFYMDTWLHDIAFRAKVAIYIPEVETVHLHFTVDKDVPFDHTYQEGLENNTWKRDKSLYVNGILQRIKSAKKIKERISL